MVGVNFNFEDLFTVPAFLWLHFTMFFMAPENDFCSRELAPFANDWLMCFFFVLLFVSFGYDSAALLAFVIVSSALHVVHTEFTDFNVPLAVGTFLSFN